MLCRCVSLWDVSSLKRYCPCDYQTFRALSRDPTLYLCRIERYAPQKRYCYWPPLPRTKYHGRMQLGLFLPIISLLPPYISTGLVSVAFWSAPSACQIKLSKNRFLTKSGKFVWCTRTKRCARKKKKKKKNSIQPGFRLRNRRDSCFPTFTIFMMMVLILQFSY